MKSTKLKLSEIKIQSFVTSLSENDSRQNGLAGFAAQSGGWGASVTSECCEGESSRFCTEGTCAVVYCATNDQSCLTDDSRANTCSLPGENGC